MIVRFSRTEALEVGAYTGGLLGAPVGAGMSQKHADIYAEGVRRGGTLVSVKNSDTNEGTVEQIMQEHHPVDPVERAAGGPRPT